MALLSFSLKVRLFKEKRSIGEEASKVVQVFLAGEPGF
jgi:hypothetical protein